MHLQHAGYVGLFEESLGRERIEELVLVWLECFGRVEQTVGRGVQPLTQIIRSASDLAWEKNIQFRVLSNEQFAWIYVNLDAHVMETSGLVVATGPSLCHDVLNVLPGCCEIIDDRNDRRLDELEARGLM